MNEFTAVLVGFILTLFIYSYLVGDNPLYRLAVHLLVGVSAAYAAVIAVQELFLPLARQLLADPAATDSLLWLVPLVFALLLLLSWLRPVAWLADSSVGALVGAGAAVALVGTTTGTLLPQITAVDDNLPLAMSIAVLTVLALLYFQFTGKAGADGTVTVSGGRRIISVGGRLVLTIAFAALFAGLLATSLALLVERVGFFVTWMLDLFGGFVP
jgi:hypothetical protein